MTLRVEQGKGRKDRYAMLSPVLLERLRAWWRLGHAQGKILPSGWLFPGMDPTDHVTARQLNRAVHLAAATAGLDKRVTPHVLPGGFHRIRHYGLLANGNRRANLARHRRITDARAKLSGDARQGTSPFAERSSATVRNRREA